jgi:hypothetical protein
MKTGLSNFLRFMSTTGLSRLNQVIEGTQYEHWMDYYKDLRSQIILALASGKTARLEEFVSRHPDDAKVPNYALCASKLITWMAKNDYKFLGRVRPATWTEGELRVPVNPEVRMEVDGQECLVKLYMAKEKLSPSAKKAYAYLVNQTLGQHSKLTPAILDLRTGKLYMIATPNNRIGLWVRSEAAAFIAMWKMNRAA